MTMIRRLLALLRVRDQDSIELAVIDRQIARESHAVAHAAGEARGLETTFSQLGETVRAFLTDAISPGVIDENEAATLSRQLVAGGSRAHAHTQTLEALVS